MNRFLHIAYATDSKYLLPTKVAAGSAIAWSSQKSNLVIDILDCGISDEEWADFVNCLTTRFGREFELARHQIDMKRYLAYPSWHLSKGLYARFDLPELLLDADWCVYCDGDTLFTADPFELMGLFDSRYALLGHKDRFNEQQVKWHTGHNLPFYKDERVCSGFLCMNLKWFRENGKVQELYRFVENYADVIYPDQDALNYVCHGKIGLLPDGWGCFSLFSDSLADLKAVHYTVERPWQLKIESNFFPIVSIIKLWFDYMQSICKIKPWNLINVGYSKWRLAICKTAFWRMVFKAIGYLPGCAKYKCSIRRIWDCKKAKRYRLPI